MTQQERFEAWATSQGINITDNGFGGYDSQWTEGALAGWEAAQAQAASTKDFSNLTNIAAIKQHAIEQEIDALRERVAELEAAQQWRPIESAPKDFTSVFDGWNGDRVCEIQWARPEYAPKDYYAWCYSEYENGYGWVNHEAKGLTHWMPLPLPPVESDDIGGHPV